MYKLARGQFRGIYLAKDKLPGLNVRFHIHAEPLRPAGQGIQSLVKSENRRAQATLGGRYRISDGQSGFSAPCRSHQQRAGAAVNPASKELVQFLDAAGDLHGRKVGTMFRSNQPGIDFQTAPLNRVIVESLAELSASQLSDFHPTPLDSILPFQAFQHDYAVRNALQLQIMAFTRAVIQKQDRAVTSRKIPLQG